MANGKETNVRIINTGGRNTRDSGGVGHNPPPPQSVKPGFKNLGFKTFPMPILPQYENINGENIIDMLEIIGLENEVKFSNIEI